jgi:hypothetical protein
MSFVLDDGPFQGVDVEGRGTSQKSIEASFGELIISEVEQEGILTALDENGEVIWRKEITGLDERSLGEITTAIHPVRETSLATIFNLYASGERLTVYVKNDGRFMYYYHSW